MVLLIIWVCVSQLYLSYTCECLDGPPHCLRDRGIASVGNVLFRKITQTVIETVRTRSDSFERFCSPSKNEHSHPNKHEKQPKFFVTALHCVSDCLSSRVTWLWWRWTRWKLGQMSDVKKSAEFNCKCKDVFIPWWSHTILKKWAPLRVQDVQILSENLKTNWAPCKFENPHDPRNPQNLQQKTLTKRQFQKDPRCQKVKPAKSWRHPQKRSAQPPPGPHNWGLVVERRVDWRFVYHWLPCQDNRFGFDD